MTALPVAFDAQHAPDRRGRFGQFGGRFVAETLMPALQELEHAWTEASVDPAYAAAYARLLADYVGRPSRLYSAERLARELGLGAIWLKREDLNHTGAHKINNALGQALLAQRMGKRRLIAETGAGQHGVATATAAALLGFPCVVYMGAVDVERQALNVARMRLLGAEVRPVTSGSSTLKDAMNEALRDWVTEVHDTHYVIGSAAGPHPYPILVRELQAVIGREARAQALEQFGRLPSHVVACVGGGSNAIGIFHGFRDDAEVALVGVEPAGEGLDTERHGASITLGQPGIFHGSLSPVLQDAHGQIQEAHSISAGLDYPGVGPEHAHLQAIGRARYGSATDHEALQAVKLLARTEGIIPALETAHAIAWVAKEVAGLGPQAHVLINLSGRGDKDMHQILAKMEAGELA